MAGELLGFHERRPMPIPEAVKQKLLKLRPNTPPMHEFGVDFWSCWLALSSYQDCATRRAVAPDCDADAD
jgi:hypothetical protein